MSTARLQGKIPVTNQTGYRRLFLWRVKAGVTQGGVPVWTLIRDLIVNYERLVQTQRLKLLQCKMVEHTCLM